MMRRVLEREVRSLSESNPVCFLIVWLLHAGTSKVITVADSSNTSCLNTQTVQPKFYFFLPGDIGQCDTIDISWQSTAQDPVDILALIPDGQSFLVANVTDNTDSIDWTANVRQGTDIMFVAGDKDGLGSGGSSDVMEISDSGNAGCINDSSPSSTGEPAAGSVSPTQGGGGDGGGSVGTATPTPAGTEGTAGTDPTNTYDGGNPTGTQDSPTGTVGSGNTDVTPTETGTGATATNDGDAPTGTEAGGDQPTGSGSSNFPGSGGGTVTGAPKYVDLIFKAPNSTNNRTSSQD